MMDGKITNISAIYQQDLTDSVTGLCNWVAVR